MTYFFYDLETSGLDPRWDRIMQFGGQRTDENLDPIGEPVNILVKITDDVIPSPKAITVTSITPQKTIAEGISEPEFLEFLHKEVFKPGTTMVGFNNVRFDDEFIRYTLYRNFHDSYEWHWKEQRSRWDIIDLVRMTRALRPEGLKWPVSAEGEPINNLEALTNFNGIKHSDAHDALADVKATIELARKTKTAQPKLFKHLEQMNNKNEAAKLVDPKNPQMIVHTSGMFRSKNQKTSIVYPIAPDPVNANAVLVYDLRRNPSEFANLSVKELSEQLFTPYQKLIAESKSRVPVKAIHLNKAPAIAPISVLDEESQARINLSIEQAQANLELLKSFGDFGHKIFSAYEAGEKNYAEDVDGQLYSGFLGDADKKSMQIIQRANEDDLGGYAPRFIDERLEKLLLRFKGRHYKDSLTKEEKLLYEEYRTNRFADQSAGLTFKQFKKEVDELLSEKEITEHKKSLLKELNDYVESIKPGENTTLV